jgi:predicted aldo/keto reductase-like oxidoreductase
MENKEDMDRRDFLEQVGLAGLGAVAARHGLAAEGEALPKLPRRRYGKTDAELSIVGFGGIALMNGEQKVADEAVAWAIERGVTYFDVAPSYGNAQDRLGPALAPYRDRCFLACKTGKRDAAGARAELENSLKVLQTDHVDLYQHHGFVKTDDVDAAFAAGGAMETFIKAKEEGKIRFLGFSAHDEKSALMALERYPFDSVLFPFNAVLLESGYGDELLKAAQAKNVALLGIKAIAWTKVQKGQAKSYPNCWYQPQDKAELANLLLRYAMDLPLTAAVSPGDVRLMKLCVEMALRYKPLTEAERADLKQQVAGVEPIFECHG